MDLNALKCMYSSRETKLLVELADCQDTLKNLEYAIGELKE